MLPFAVEQWHDAQERWWHRDGQVELLCKDRVGRNWGRGRDLLIALTWVLRRSKQTCMPWLLPLRECMLKLTGTQAEVRVGMLSFLFQITLESSGTSFGR